MGVFLSLWHAFLFMRKYLVLVAGSGEECCSKKAYRLAYETGKELAKAGFYVLTGGLDGVMDAASQGCKEAGGFSIGISPFEDDKNTTGRKTTQHASVLLYSGIGYARNNILGNSADAIIGIRGGAGTWHEISLGYFRKIPIIVLKGSGGVADQVGNTHLDIRKMGKIQIAHSPKEAVKKLEKIFKKKS